MRFVLTLSALFATPALAAPTLVSSPEGTGWSVTDSARFQITGAPANTQIRLFLSLFGEGLGLCAPDGTCLGITQPTARLTGRTNAQGEKTWSLDIPDTIFGREVCSQAAVSTPTGVVLSNVVCEPIGLYAFFGGSAYWLSGQLADYTTAEALCAERGMAVTVPESLSEGQFIQLTYGSFNFVATPWIGINDEANEGSFVRYDGSPVTWFNWAFGEPNNLNEEDCAQLYGDASWNDLTCADSKPVVCEAGVAL